MSKTNDVFLGLDGEMTGGAVQPPGQKPNFQKYQLVQIGLAELHNDWAHVGETASKLTPHWFLATIGYDQIEQNPEAMAVHKISEAEIKAATRPADVDSFAVNWLDERGIRKAIPVGYSVGSFDAPYIREYLPNLARRISMRTLDLNAVVFTISEITGRSYKVVKAAGKNYAEKMIRANTTMADPEQWKAHNAAFDALVAIYSWEYFKKILVVREVHDYL
jgi:hypothetical protein